jgi:pSer/pThr/pTyr-binding forkhead associated (FHA) protein
MSILTVTSGPMAGQLVKIDRRVVVGRSADVSIDDDELSRRHFAVHATADGVLVEDLGSTNGTFVGGERISGTVTVPGGTLIRAGQSEFTVDLHADEATTLRPIVASPPDDRTRLRAQAPTPVRPPAGAMPVAAAASAAPPAPAPGAADSPPHAAPSSPPETPTARGPDDAGLPKRGAPAISLLARIALAIVLVGAVVLTLAILGSSSTGAQTRPVSFYLRTTTREETGTTSAIDALQTGSPTGTGAALVTQTVTAPTGGALFATGAATPFTWQLATFFQNGSIRATITGTATPSNGSLTYAGTGEIVGGTGTFEQASGTLTLSGTVPPPGSAAAALATQKGANGQGGGVKGAITLKAPPPAVPLTDGGVFTITGSIRY